MKPIKNFFARFKDKNFRKVFIVVAAIILAAAGIFYFFKREGRVFIDDSLIQAPVISLNPQAGGILNEVDVTENQAVKKGDLLAVVGTQSLRALTDGVITQTSKQIGSTANAATNIVQMINPDDFRVVGTLDENKGLKDIRVGQVASFTVDAFPGDIFWGYVDEVSPTAKQTQIAFSISNERPTQQFNVYVRFDSGKYPQLKNGMSAKLTVYTNTN